jgi:hypothetical protein
MVGSNYKRSIDVVDDSHHLQEICTHFSSSSKFANDNKGSMIITNVGRWLLQNNR